MDNPLPSMQDAEASRGAMTKRAHSSLWLRWVTANAFGEMFGLGLTFAAAAAGFSWLASLGGVQGILAGFLLAIASGIFEATLVGWGQWWAMRPWFPAIRRGEWWRATAVGALIAYVVGYLPSTIMDLGAEAASSPAVQEPPQAIVLLLAAGMGLAGGAVLSFAQWLVLRKHVQKASLWIPANMLTWMIGMPLIFWAIDHSQLMDSLAAKAGWLMVMLLAVGVIVGAIHGLVLTRLAGHARKRD